jgi:UDP-3-O-[3-hydroxymyristoyl] glucosamine N-acyltransferase
MQHPGFFVRSPPLRLADLANRLGAGLAPQANGESLIEDVRPLAEAQPQHLSFLDNRKYMPQLGETRAGACLIAAEFADRVPPGTAALALKAPYRGFAMALQIFYPDALQPKAAMVAAGEPQVHPSARIAEGALVEPSSAGKPRSAGAPRWRRARSSATAWSSARAATSAPGSA